jgi:hypothetical protein
VNSVTRNLLDFYKINETNTWYLNKLFTATDNLGYYKPYAKNPVDTEWNQKDPYIGTIDEINTYNINGLGFRGEVYEDSDLVAIGCSITFGLGVPEYSRWTNLLGNKTQKGVLNLGSPGASVESICNTIIQYCVNNKMPKEIFCLMPDFFRRMVITDKEFYKTKGNTWAENKDHLEYAFCNPTVAMVNSDSIFMEIKDKKYIEDSVSPHQLILNSVNSIYALESFCLSNNIKLYWTTWDLPSAIIMEHLSKIKDFKLKNFSQFFPPNTEKRVGSFILESCNSDHDSEFIDSVCWRTGSDYSIVDSKKVTNLSHPGIHFHHHFADFFYSLHNSKSTS